MCHRGRALLVAARDGVRFVVALLDGAARIVCLFRPVPPGVHYPPRPRRVTDPDEWARQNRHACHPHDPDRDL